MVFLYILHRLFEHKFGIRNHNSERAVGEISPSYYWSVAFFVPTKHKIAELNIFKYSVHLEL